MARLTPERDALVVRLVYDGPPRSGKTTSLRALAQGMAQSVFSPGEAAGRTQYFDWLEYLGGSFEGIPIRCQILSVPGQQGLEPRRRALLAEADAVVFVANGTAEHLPSAVARLNDLRELLEARPSPRPGVVVQANQRDRPEALPLPALDDAFGAAGLALVESVATENRGIREAFVLAVRLALDRARELLRQGDLPAGAGDTDDPAALLAWLKTVEGESPGETPPREEPPRAAPARNSQSPRLPDSTAPSGRVWPPIDGRALLHAASTPAPSEAPRQGRDGSWLLRSGVWYFHSAPRHEFEHLEDAKEELVHWAQRHQSGFARLSPRRCITLAETGWGTWRLWQVLRVEETWRQRVEAALRPGPAAGPPPVDLLRTCADRLLTARAAFRQEPPLPCRLEVLGESRGRPHYVGLLPPVSWHPSPRELELSDDALFRRELEPLAQGWPWDELLAAIVG